MILLPAYTESMTMALFYSHACRAGSKVLFYRPNFAHRQYHIITLMVTLLFLVVILYYLFVKV